MAAIAETPINDRLNDLRDLLPRIFRHLTTRDKCVASAACRVFREAPIWDQEARILFTWRTGYGLRNDVDNPGGKVCTEIARLHGLVQKGDAALETPVKSADDYSLELSIAMLHGAAAEAALVARALPEVDDKITLCRKLEIGLAASSLLYALDLRPFAHLKTYVDVLRSRYNTDVELQLATAHFRKGEIKQGLALVQAKEDAIVFMKLKTVEPLIHELIHEKAFKKAMKIIQEALPEDERHSILSQLRGAIEAAKDWKCYEWMIDQEKDKDLSPIYTLVEGLIKENPPEAERVLEKYRTHIDQATKDDWIAVQFPFFYVELNLHLRAWEFARKYGEIDPLVFKVLKNAFEGANEPAEAAKAAALIPEDDAAES